ncbi:MAG: T9SS type A sorting domain-containing protein [Candidatus Cloacimonetes bacterium]|nr:T9SS type A sorting domain-containing protein [Candidatus Cloacimonadota bacterium]
MKKKYLIILILFSTIYLFAEIETEWTATFGGSYSDAANSICITPDNDFILAGYTNSFGAGNSDVYLIKTDADGNEVWSQTYGGSGWENAKAVCNAVGNDGYVTAGYTTSSESNSFDVLIVKINSNGNVQWVQVYGGDQFDTAESICRTSDDGYLLCGYTSSFGAGEDDIYLIKTDADGDSLWTKTIGCERSDMGHSIKPTSDGNYIISGSTGLYDAPYPGSNGRNREIYIIKIDEAGDILAENTFWVMDTHQNSFDTGYDICETSDGGFCVVGCTSQHLQELMDVAVLKVDPQLNEVWKTNTEMEAYYDYGYSICEDMENGSLYICGSFKYVNTAKADMFCLLLDSEGNEIEREYFGSTGSECGCKILQLNDGSLVISGYTSSFGEGSNDVWLLKICNPNLQSPQDEIPIGSQFFQIYPNPFNPETTISFKISSRVLDQNPTRDFKNTNIEIYNLKGQRIREFKIQNLKFKINSIVWDGTDQTNQPVSSGIYFCVLRNNGKILVSKKMILLK